MPGMNGVEVCQQLRNIPHHKNTPVIFVTLYADFENRAKSVVSGGDDFISKPISPLELIVKATVFMLSMPRPKVPREQPRLRNPAPLPEAGDSTSRAEEEGVAGAATEPTNVGNGAKKLGLFQATVDEKLKD